MQRKQTNPTTACVHSYVTLSNSQRPRSFQGSSRHDVRGLSSKGGAFHAPAPCPRVASVFCGVSAVLDEMCRHSHPSVRFSALCTAQRYLSLLFVPQKKAAATNSFVLRAGLACSLGRTMGLAFSRLWERMFGKKEMRILMVSDLIILRVPYLFSLRVIVF